MSTAQSTAPVEYRPIEGWPGYRIGNDGSTWTCIVLSPGNGKGYTVAYDGPWKPLKQVVVKGYLVACLNHRGRKQQRKVHQLVLEAFVGLRPPGTEGCHKDGNQFNNWAWNLYWGTDQDNADDRSRHGRQVRGEKCHAAKITAEQATEIRAMYADGAANMREIGALYGIGKSQVFRIIKGLKWAHVMEVLHP